MILLQLALSWKLLKEAGISGLQPFYHLPSRLFLLRSLNNLAKHLDDLMKMSPLEKCRPWKNVALGRERERERFRCLDIVLDCHVFQCCVIVNSNGAKPF